MKKTSYKTNSEFIQNGGQIDKLMYKPYFRKSIKNMADEELKEYIIFLDYVINNKLLAEALYEYDIRKITDKFNIEYLDNIIEYNNSSEKQIKDHKKSFLKSTNNLEKEYARVLIKNKYYLFNKMLGGNNYNERIVKKLCKYGNIELAKWIMQNNKIDIHFYDDTLFITACKNGNKKMAELIFSIDEDIISESYDEAYLWACENNHKEIVEWLIDGLDNETKTDGFVAACENGQIEMAMWLSTQMDIKEKNCIHDALNLACKYGHTDIISYLLEIDDNEYIDEEVFIEICGSNDSETLDLIIQSPNIEIDCSFKDACQAALDNKNIVIMQILIDNYGKRIN